MKLNKKQMLLVHNVLFSHLSNASIVTRDLEDLMDLLSDELIGQPDKQATMGCKNVRTDSDCVQYFDYSDEEEDEYDCELHDHEECDDHDDEELDDQEVIEQDFLTSLQPLKAYNANSKRVKLHFYTKGGKLHLSVDDGSVEFVDITAVCRRGRELQVYTSPGGFVLQYEVLKFPKDWTANLQVNVKYEIVR
jgi:hypothetical protein